MIVVEGSETVLVTLQADAAYTIGSPNNATVTILDFLHEPNTAPVFQSIPTLIQIAELRLLQFTLEATDQEAPAQKLTFSLAPGAPLGALLGTNGDFQWRPGERDGPGTYPITVRVTDDGTPPLSDSATFSVVVDEVNSAPVFVDTREKYVKVGSQLRFPTAMDFDIPANALTVALGPDSPKGLTLDPFTGLCVWIPELVTGGHQPF